MRIPLILAALALTLGGCVTDRQLSNYLCKHQASSRIAARAALAKAASIKDPVARQAAEDAANATLDALDACPPTDAGDTK